MLCVLVRTHTSQSKAKRSTERDTHHMKWCSTTRHTFPARAEARRKHSENTHKLEEYNF